MGNIPPNTTQDSHGSRRNSEEALRELALSTPIKVHVGPPTRAGISAQVNPSTSTNTREPAALSTTKSSTDSSVEALEFQPKPAAPTVTQQKEEVPQRDENYSVAPSLVETNLLKLIDKASNGRVFLCQLPATYSKAYGAEIPYKDAGHTKLSSFLETLPHVSTCVDGGGAKSYIYRNKKAKTATKLKPAALTDAEPAASTDTKPTESTNAKPAASTGVGKTFPSTDEEKALLLADVKVAAGKFNGTKLHKDMLRFLGRHPNGVSGSLVNKNVPGLETFIHQVASESAFLMPRNLFLRHCPGVDGKENHLGQNMLYLDSSVPKDDDSELRVGGIGDDDDDDETRTSDDRGGETRADLVKAAALKLTGTKVHKNILALLAEHPEGLSANRVSKHAKGLVPLIKKLAEELDEVYFAPGLLLMHCEGVSKKQVAGHTVFFVRREDRSSPESIGHGGNGTADGAAAVAFLRLLDRTYRGRPWPQTKKQLKQVIPSLDLHHSAAIMSWLQQGIEDDLSEAKKQKEALKRAMRQFKKMGCLSGTNKDLKWNLGTIRRVVDQDDSAPIPPRQLPSPNQPENTMAIQQSGDAPIVVVDTADSLAQILLTHPFSATTEEKEEVHVVAVDCEGVPENLYLVQVGVPSATYVFDCVKLGEKEVCAALRPLLTNSHIIKLFHDLHNDAVALEQLGGVAPLFGTLDTQLAIESLTGDLHIGFNQMLQQFGQEHHPLKQSLKRRMDDGRIFSQRPLPPDALRYAALDVSLLLRAKESIFTELGSTRSAIERASDSRARMALASGGLRQICFDVANSYGISSRELLEELRPHDMLGPSKLEVSDDTNILLDMLPADLRQNLFGRTRDLSDIVLDKGREPLAWIKGDRVHLGSEERTVSEADINAIVDRLGGFGGDNRAGLEKQLHRISAMRNRQQDIIGLTLRVGRHVSGNATMISDLMFADCTQSILFLGEPGSGKTTVVREVTRQLAERFNVCIVDTSNEIAGDGDIPHPCVGYARRMMVPSLDKQSAVMVECVQNHTPEVMVIDEIGRPTEVEAARTCKQRGVRLIASAHGDLRKLIKNPKLRGLVGGVETVTLGDAQAKEEAKKSGKSGSGGLQKLKAQRGGPPTFDIIVELRRGAQHEWRVVLDVGDAVDKVLEGLHYKAQRRTRNPETGALTLELEKA